LTVGAGAPGVARAVAVTLARQGVTVARLDEGRVTVFDGGRAVPAPDLLILDADSGHQLEAVRRLARQGRRVPALFFLGPEQDPALAVFSADYVVAPLHAGELAARVGSALHTLDTPEPGRAGALLALADLELDDDAHRVRRDGRPVELSVTEYRLLRYLLLNTGRVLSRDQILDHVWGYDFSGRTHVIETYVSYLRRKVDAVGPPLIHTVRGVGYVMRAPEE
jgi:two-component system OmpR family response regulator